MNASLGRLNRRLLIGTALLCSVSVSLIAQESIHSNADLYYDFLALTGKIERPYLDYKTMEDSNWIPDGMFRIYGLELYSSYNSALPYGGNDGALWQGRGLNSSLTGGFRIADWGFELTIKPEVDFSQNLSFALMTSAYPNPYGYFWGISSGAGVDAPQRFGDQPFFTFSWGDSELRYSWKTLTLGFGWQSPWVGPGRINAIMHSNNAPPYPKLDLGLRRTRIELFGLYFGDVEARLWGGYLSESAYFDYDSSNDHNLISFLSFAFSPSPTPGLTLFVNRSYLSPWTWDSVWTFPKLLIINLKGGGAQDVWDQRASFGFDWLAPSGGIEVYGEAGINDYMPSLEAYIRYPFHSMVYTGGVRKALEVGKLKSELLFEWSNMELSQDFQFFWPDSFYMHYQIAQGYTNGGQWLGSQIGTGGNSQYLGWRQYCSPSSGYEIHIMRTNPDNDYIYARTILTGNSITWFDAKDFRANLEFGGSWYGRIGNNLALSLGGAIIQIHNPTYDASSYMTDKVVYSYRLDSRVSVSLN